MKKNKDVMPLITVIVPIYNAENWIRRCMDSLVYQTLENIEIIAVNNGSTDDTKKILEEYKSYFPSKVQVASIEHTNGPGGGRNYGLSHAKASYIIFADSDDYFDLDALRQMYEKAINGNHDMVYCASYDVIGNKKKVTRTLEKTDKSYVQRYGSMVFWNKLVKKELFDMAGKVPEDIVFEDIAYVSTLISYSKNIGYIDKPLYYYIIREDSGVNDLSSERILHSLVAYETAIKNCDESVKPELIASIAHRICYDLRKARWTFADHFINYVQENKDIFDIEFVKADTRTFSQLQEIYALDYAPFPQKVYVNGFKENINEYVDYVREKAFWGTTEVIVLDEKNCDLKKLPILEKAHKKGDLEFIAQYFAMDKIYETGGIYLNNISIINIFNCLRYCQSFFSFLDDKTFSGDVFGGIKGNSVFGEILKTYEYKGWFSETRCTLEDRVKNILVVKEKIKLNGMTQKKKDTCVFGPEVMVSDIIGEYHICTHNFNEENINYTYISKNTLNAILKKK